MSTTTERTNPSLFYRFLVLLTFLMSSTLAFANPLSIGAGLYEIEKLAQQLELSTIAELEENVPTLMNSIRERLISNPKLTDSSSPMSGIVKNKLVFSLGIKEKGKISGKEYADWLNRKVFSPFVEITQVEFTPERTEVYQLTSTTYFGHYDIDDRNDEAVRNQTRTIVTPEKFTFYFTYKNPELATEFARIDAAASETKRRAVEGTRDQNTTPSRLEERTYSYFGIEDLE